MSQYNLSGKRPGVRVLLGWDRPLQSYFASIYDPAKPPLYPEESDATRHVGLLGEPYDIESADALAALVIDDVEVEPAVLAALKVDKANGR